MNCRLTSAKCFREARRPRLLAPPKDLVFEVHCCRRPPGPPSPEAVKLSPKARHQIPNQTYCPPKHALPRYPGESRSNFKRADLSYARGCAAPFHSLLSSHVTGSRQRETRDGGNVIHSLIRSRSAGLVNAPLSSPQHCLRFHTYLSPLPSPSLKSRPLALPCQPQCFGLRRRLLTSSNPAPCLRSPIPCNGAPAPPLQTARVQAVP